jgi:hypothetical protein
MFALASVQDVETRLGRTFPTESPELGRVAALLDDASALVRDVAGTTWINPTTGDPVEVPGTIRYVVLRAVERAIRNPDGFSAESDGDYSYQRTGVEPGVYLTPGEEKAIRRAMGRSGLWTQPVYRGDMCVSNTVWVEDQYGCELFPIDTYYT